jgi:hypothetical protein
VICSFFYQSFLVLKKITLDNLVEVVAKMDGVQLKLQVVNEHYDFHFRTLEARPPKAIETNCPTGACPESGSQWGSCRQVEQKRAAQSPEMKLSEGTVTSKAVFQIGLVDLDNECGNIPPGHIEIFLVIVRWFERPLSHKRL